MAIHHGSHTHTFVALHHTLGVVLFRAKAFFDDDEWIKEENGTRDADARPQVSFGTAPSE